MSTESLFDTLAGAAGRPINRIGINAAVANSQAINGLRTAQTEDALAKAEDARRQFASQDSLEGKLGDYFTSIGDPHAPEHAKAAVGIASAGYGKDFRETEAGLLDALKGGAFQTVTNPNADPNARLAADQGLNPGANPYQAVEGQLVPRFGGASQTGAAGVQQTPVSTASVGEKNAHARELNAQADAGGFNPHTGQGNPLSNLPDEQQAAIQASVNKGLLSLQDVNSRNVGLYGQMALNNPDYDFNQAARDRALGRNATFQQKNMIVEGLPGNISHVTSLGKKLDYSGVKFIGEGEKYLRGETNDPALTEYMTARNDTLLKLANVMRGIGMSDQAHQAEIEAMHPTLDQHALDAWAKAQMSQIVPLIQSQSRAAHSHPQGATVPTGTTPTTPQGGVVPDASDPLGLRSP